MALAALAVVGVVLRPERHAHEVARLRPSSVASSAGASPAPTDFATRLAALDAIRQRAFAERRTDLLDGVYASAALRQQDAALIDRMVPTGCGLVGVHTTYQDVRTVTVTSDSVELSASVRLAPSTLKCGASSAGVADGLPSTAVRITLQRATTGYLIADLWMDS